MEYDKGNYSTDKKMYSENSMGHNPNEGENHMHFTGNTEYKRDETAMDMAGVEYGLGSLETIEVKNAEMVCPNQRPKGNKGTVTGNAGSFTILVS